MGPTLYKRITPGVISVNLHTHTETFPSSAVFGAKEKRREGKRRRFLFSAGAAPSSLCPCPHARASRHRLRSERPVSLSSVSSSPPRGSASSLGSSAAGASPAAVPDPWIHHRSRQREALLCFLLRLGCVSFPFLRAHPLRW